MKNIRKHKSLIKREDRRIQSGHKSTILWFTGLSGAGKSTIAHHLERILYERGCRTYVLDGDNVRHGLCADLGFSEKDRVENIRRIGEVSKLFVDAGVIVLAAFISPYKADRDAVRNLMENSKEFVEIYCHADISVCEKRDTKGFYAKAKIGEIDNFTGISAPYEPPLDPEIFLETGTESLEGCVNKVIDYLETNKVVDEKIR